MMPFCVRFLYSLHSRLSSKWLRERTDTTNAASELWITPFQLKPKGPEHLPELVGNCIILIQKGQHGRCAPPIRGPLPLITSNSIPKAGRGVRMSLKKMTPSVLKALQGCNESSIAISGVSERLRKGYLSENFRNSAM
jgi:hypothetical protein